MAISSPDVRGVESVRVALPKLPVAAAILAVSVSAAGARELASTVTELDTLPKVRAEYQLPNEPNQLFYIQRSSNANTVVYTAKLDERGNIDRGSPVDAFWRWFNVDGRRKALNFIERAMAYGVSARRARPQEPVTFTVAALPERPLTLAMDDQGRPEALMQIGARTVKLAYVFLHVVDTGLIPSVPALEVFGIDKATGKAIHEHLIPK